MTILRRIEILFSGHGANYYGGEAITQTEHALQSAYLSEQAGDPEPLVVASLLHDLGHLVMAEDSTTDMRHQEVGADLLAVGFGPAVTEPIRLHVAAKRYLCATEPGYQDALSPASQHSLALQGGPFDAAQAQAFLAQPHGAEAVRLRRYDDLAKVVGLVTPPLEHYLPIVERCLRRPLQEA
ncbi:phosphonate degradation HD-domain oxygenase [Cupriavidus sp. 30B13]|uniref:phosphonate degradation HD-domain oxygenase n=1 Tax=Cupriavidus sp. 30B13 TaxID=3384241 RepID=UPI003B91D322